MISGPPLNVREIDITGTTVKLIWSLPSAQCGFSFKGKFPTNLKLHLQKTHPSDYKEFIESEKKRHEKANEKAVKLSKSGSY